MPKSFAHAAALALLLLLSGCGVLLTGFAVSSQAAPGTVISVVIDGDISGLTGEAGCVLQLPNGWTVSQQTSFPIWPVTRDAPGLLASYVAEPGHYLVGYSGTGQSNGMGGGTVISHISITVSVLVPLTAPNQQFVLKVSLAGNSTVGGPWTITEPAGIAQFAQITAASYARPIAVGAPTNLDFQPAGIGLPGAGTAPVWTGVACGDIDGDGADDLVATSAGQLPRCWLSRPGGTWVERSPTLGPTTAIARVAFDRLDPDPFLDFVDGNGNVYFGDGGTTWTHAWLPLAIGATNYVAVATGDVDRDGHNDIAIAGPNRVQVLLNNGNRTFRNASAGLPAGSGTEDMGNLLLADVTGDGNLDLLWARWNLPNVWLGDGLGGWTLAAGFPNPMSAVAAADLNADGVAEIIAGLGSTGIRVFQHAGGTSWITQPIFGLPVQRQFTSVAALDYDRDGRPDIVGGEAGVSVRLWRHIGTGFAESLPSGLPSPTTSACRVLGVGDFDGNTFPDLAVVMMFWLPGSTSEVQAYQNQRTGVAPFGAGCDGPGVAAPVLASVGAPQRGNAAFAMQVLHTPGAFAAFWFGPSRTSAPPFALPLDLAFVGAPGCTLWAQPEVIFTGFVGPGGDLTIALPVPNDPYFALATVYAQGSVFTTANQFGMVLSAGSAIRIQ